MEPTDDKDDFRSELEGGMGLVADEGGVFTWDWANFALLHSTAQLLAEAQAQVQSLEDGVERRDQELQALREELRRKEERATELSRQNEALRAQLSQLVSPSAPTTDKGVQVDFRLIPRTLSPPTLSPAIVSPRQPHRDPELIDLDLEAPPSTSRLPVPRSMSPYATSPQHKLNYSIYPPPIPRRGRGRPPLNRKRPLSPDEANDSVKVNHFGHHRLLLQSPPLNFLEGDNSPTHKPPVAPGSVSSLIPSEVENCMTTSTPYYIRDQLEVEEEMEESQETEEVEGVQVEVPKWRRMVFSPLPIPSEEEPEEEVNESVFLRRHLRLEIDEKRRKRWDSQRVREESYLEKLKRKMEERERVRTKRRRAAAGRRLEREKGKGGGESEEERELEAVHPQPQDVLYIRVSEEIPISLFGHPLPILQKTHFDLPWSSDNARPSLTFNDVLAR